MWMTAWLKIELQTAKQLIMRGSVNGKWLGGQKRHVAMQQGKIQTDIVQSGGKAAKQSCKLSLSHTVHFTISVLGEIRITKNVVNRLVLWRASHGSDQKQDDKGTD